jgi:hypothetical protein
LFGGSSPTSFGPKLTLFNQKFLELKESAITTLAALKDELDSTRIINPGTVEILLDESKRLSRQLRVVEQILNPASQDDKVAISDELDRLNTVVATLAISVASVADKFNNELVAIEIETLKLQFSDLYINIWATLKITDKDGQLAELPNLFRYVWEEIARVKDENDDLTRQQRQLLDRVDYFVRVTGPQCLLQEGKDGLKTIKDLMQPQGSNYSALAIEDLWAFVDTRFFHIIEKWDAILTKLLNPDIINPICKPPAVVVQGNFGSLEVLVMDNANPGKPVEGAPVIFTAPENGPSGTFKSTNTRWYRGYTDNYGRVITSDFIANNVPGDFNVKAAIASPINPAVFGLTIKPAPVPPPQPPPAPVPPPQPPPASGPAGPKIQSILPTLGNGQEAVVGDRFSEILEVEVMDSNKNPVPGVDVRFVAPIDSGNYSTGIFVKAGQSVVVPTDANGTARSPYFTANGKPGSFSISAAVSNDPRLICNFKLKNKARPAGNKPNSGSNDNPPDVEAEELPG